MSEKHPENVPENASTNAPEKKPSLVSRRGLFVGAAAGLVVGGLEWASLRGRFDHRRAAGGEARGAKERFAASLRSTEAGTSGIVHVAHSTHLIALGGMRLLTDPWFYHPAFGALSHEVVPAVAPSELGPLNAVLVTHDHADHADLRAMDAMDKRAAVIVATSDLAARVRACGFSDVSVLAPWEERRLGEVTIAAVPGLHDIYEIGFVVRVPGKSVYFAGDSRLHPDIPAIAERFRPDVSILPVDGTRLAGAPLHVMTPEDAVTAARMLGSKLVMPSHAEALFSDPLAGNLLASMVPRARHRFAEVMAKELPASHAGCPSPASSSLLMRRADTVRAPGGRACYAPGVSMRRSFLSSAALVATLAISLPAWADRDRGPAVHLSEQRASTRARGDASMDAQRPSRRRGTRSRRTTRWCRPRPR